MVKINTLDEYVDYFWPHWRPTSLARIGRYVSPAEGGNYEFDSNPITSDGKTVDKPTFFNCANLNRYCDSVRAVNALLIEPRELSPIEVVKIFGSNYVLYDFKNNEETILKMASDPPKPWEKRSRNVRIANEIASNRLHAAPNMGIAIIAPNGFNHVVEIFNRTSKDYELINVEEKYLHESNRAMALLHRKGEVQSTGMRLQSNHSDPENLSFITSGGDDFKMLERNKLVISLADLVKANQFIGHFGLCAYFVSRHHPIQGGFHDPLK